MSPASQRCFSEAHSLPQRNTEELTGSCSSDTMALVQVHVSMQGQEALFPKNMSLKEVIKVLKEQQSLIAATQQNARTTLQLLQDTLLVKDAMEKEERRRKIEYGRAKLALYRKRKVRRDGHMTKKTKKISGCKQDEHTSNINEGTDELFKNDCEGTDPEWTPDATEMTVLAGVQTENPNEVLVEASETLQSSTHSSAPAELVLQKQQVHDQQQLLEQQYHLLKDSEKKEEELKNEVTFLQEELKEQDKKLNHANNTLLEKQTITDDLHERKTEEEKKSAVLQNQLKSADKLVADLREQLIVKDQENKNIKLELARSKEKENHYLLEIKDLQQKNYQVNITNTDTEQSTEREASRKLDHLQVELGEMYGREIMHMKEELIQQHGSQLEDLQSHHKNEMETVLSSYENTTVDICNLYKRYKEQLYIFNMIISGQDIK